MMILHTSPPSPYGRKVKIAAAMLGLSDQIEIVIADTSNPRDPIRALNPLGKIPALVLDDGPVLFDSRVITEYLDHRAGGHKLYPTGDAWVRVRTQEAMADGILDASILQVYEKRFRDEAKHEPRWLSYQAEKVDRALAVFERTQPDGPRTIADIALACVLGYLDLRFEGLWRERYPRLEMWLARFAAEVPAFEATRVKA